VLGASFDTPEDNKAFADAEAFGFRLLSDADRAVGTAYGAVRPPDDPYASMPKRVSFLIDPEGVIRRTYEVKDTAAHADEVLADLDQLRAG
jgi:thioredoxin-dependent peroxiredoxin